MKLVTIRNEDNVIVGRQYTSFTGTILLTTCDNKWCISTDDKVFKGKETFDTREEAEDRISFYLEPSTVIAVKMRTGLIDTGIKILFGNKDELLLLESDLRLLVNNSRVVCSENTKHLRIINESFRKHMKKGDGKR